MNTLRGSIIFMEKKEFWDNAYQKGAIFYEPPMRALDIFIPRAKRWQHALDIGGGTGKLALYLHKRGYHTEALDISREALKQITNGAIVKTLRDIEVRTPKGKKFDIITCKFVYFFIQSKQKFLRKVKKILKKGGLFLFINAISLKSPGAVEKGKILADVDAVFGKSGISRKIVLKTTRDDKVLILLIINKS